MHKQQRRVAVNDPRLNNGGHQQLVTASQRRPGSTGRPTTNGKTAVKKGPRRIADPRDIKEHRQNAASRDTAQPKRRVSMQHTTTPNGIAQTNRNSQRVRRQSAPTLSLAPQANNNNQQTLARERQKLQDLRISHGMLNSISPEKNVGRIQSEDPVHLGAIGRRVSFIPIVEEVILSPLREEEGLEDEFSNNSQRVSVAAKARNRKS